MKKHAPIRPALSALLMLSAAAVLADSLVVKVKTTSLKEEPVFYSNTVAVLNSGEQLEKLAEQKGWYKIRTQDNREGWLHSSAVKIKKFSLVAADKPVESGASAEEVALAGKGFNQQVEEKYRADNPGVSFAAVDNMLALEVTPEQLKAFLENGRLGEFGGGK